MGRYDKLLSPLRLTDSVTLKNRMVKSPQATMYWNEDGTVSDRGLATYENMAKGGAGALIIGGMSWEEPPAGVIYCRNDDDRFIPGLKKMTDAIHAHDCKVIAQFHHLGPSARGSIDGRPPMGPSAIAKEDLPSPAPHLMPGREVTKEEMAVHKQGMVDFARRAKAAGFDGVEVHAANGYYLASFLTDIWNKRTDEYGTQTMENRTRFVCEVIRAIREEVGEDFLVGVRINGQEWGAPGAVTPDIAAQTARYLEAAGVNYISVNGYGYGPLPFKYCPDYFPYPEPEEHMKPFMEDYATYGINMPGTRAVKEAVKVPVVAAGRMDEDLAEEVLEKGWCDVIALGRTLFADPEFPNKVKEGRLEDIVRCTRCSTCEDPLTEPRKCRVNPSLGHELEFKMESAKKRKKVMVVGGGPSGMEAARVAALRGHDVTLYEKAGELGGKTKLAAMIKGDKVENVMPIMEYLTAQISKAGVTVKLNTEVTAETVKREAPDAVVVAASSPYAIPEIPGIHGRNVMTIPQLTKMSKPFMKLFGPKRLNQLSNIFLPISKDIVIIGGEIEALQGAVFMRKRGRKVTVIESADRMGARVPEKFINRMYDWFPKKGVELIKGEAVEVDGKGVKVRQEDGTMRHVPGKTVLVMKPQAEDKHFANEIKPYVKEVYCAGAVLGADNGLFKDALRDGRAIGCAL